MKVLVIADVQAKPGVNFDYLRALGNYIVHKKPDVIVNIGDFCDMPSLSSYDKGKKSFEGRRYKNDIRAGREAMDALLGPMKDYNAHQKAQKGKQYRPRMVLTLGNHEERIMRAVNEQAELEGLLSYDDLPYEDWEVHDYLKPVSIGGFIFVHYLANPMTGKPYSGTALSQLTKVGQSFVVGHKQTLDIATRYLLDGSPQWGFINGAFMSTMKIIRAIKAIITLEGCSCCTKWRMVIVTR
jgi:hypothetical protein